MSNLTSGNWTAKSRRKKMKMYAEIYVLQQR
jgi:hypothetical protein